MKQLLLGATLFLSPFACASTPVDLAIQPWVACEFMLLKPGHARWAVNRFDEIARLKPSGKTHLNDSATGKAWAAFGLPKNKKLKLQMTSEGPLHKVLIKNGRKIVSSLIVHFPPILVWKEFPSTADRVELDYTLRNETMDDIGLGSVYQKGGLRKYVAFTLGSRKEDVGLVVGIDVPCDELAEYTPQIAQYIILNQHELMCRVELLSSWAE